MACVKKICFYSLYLLLIRLILRPTSPDDVFIGADFHAGMYEFFLVMLNEKGSGKFKAMIWPIADGFISEDYTSVYHWVADMSLSYNSWRFDVVHLILYPQATLTMSAPSVVVEIHFT